MGLGGVISETSQFNRSPARDCDRRPLHVC